MSEIRQNLNTKSDYFPAPCFYIPFADLGQEENLTHYFGFIPLLHSWQDFSVYPHQDLLKQKDNNPSAAKEQLQDLR